MADSDSFDEAELQDILPDEAPRRGRGGRKPARKQQPSSEESSGDGMDEDLFYDEKDRYELLHMPDVQREEILFERAEKRKDALERKRLAKERGVSTKSSDRTRSREYETKSRSSALDDMKARRQKSKRASHRSSDSDDYHEDRYSDRHRDDYHGYHDDDRRQREPTLTLEDLMPIIVDRNKIEKWYGDPYFIKDTKGLFVRITYGSSTTLRAYRLVEILNVIESTSKTYKLGKKECNHLLAIKIGNSVKEYEMQYISNSPVTDGEFKMWLDSAIKENEVPSKEDIAQLSLQIKHADTYVPTPEDIAEQVRRNREKNPNAVTNIAHEKLKLQKAIEEERENGNLRKAEELQRQLKELIERQEQLDSKKLREKTAKLAALNKRNTNADKETRVKAAGLGLGDVVDQKSSAFDRRHTLPEANWLKGASLKGVSKQASNNGAAPPNNNTDSIPEDPSQASKQSKLHARAEEEGTPSKKMKMSFDNEEIEVHIDTSSNKSNSFSLSGSNLLQPNKILSRTTSSSDKPIKKLSFSSYLEGKGTSG